MENHSINILFIEDDLFEQQNFERFIKRNNLNYQYQLATTLKDAICLLESTKFDLILADIVLSDGTAFDLYSLIPSFIPVIFITGDENKKTILEAIRFGVADYFIKEADGKHLDALPECIDRLLNKQSSLFKHLKKQIELHKNSIKSSLQLPNVVLDALLFQTHIGAVITDAKANILRVNKGFSDITGYSSSEVVGKSMNILKSGKQDKFFYQKFWKQLIKTGMYQGALWNRGKNHALYLQWATITAIPGKNKEDTKYVAILSNVTEQYQAEQEIRKMAFFDALTSLANRRLLQDRLKQELAMTKRSKRYGSIIYLDLDRFKALNDNFGHHSGDQLLIQVAERLNMILREEDTAARLGGDEFVILIHANKPTTKSASEDALFIAEKIKKQLNIPFQLEDRKYHITPSIGYTTFPDNGTIAEEFLKRADKAMYCSKYQGGNSISIFQADNEEQDNKLIFHIALIEDNNSDALLAIDTLKEFSIDCDLTVKVKSLANGEMGIDYLISNAEKNNLPDLILLDLNLPTMDGFEVLRQLKSNNSLKNIPVVVFTQTTEHTIIDKCINLQVDDFIQKPMSVEIFKQTLRNIGMGTLLINSTP